MKPEGSDSFEVARELLDILRRPATRYRVCVVETADIRAAALTADFLSRECECTTLDALSPALVDRVPPHTAPMDVIRWLKSSLNKPNPFFLLHVDAILATWLNVRYIEVWWEQLALVESSVPLLVATARSDLGRLELQTTTRWKRIERTLTLADAEVCLWVPREASLFP